MRITAAIERLWLFAVKSASLVLGVGFAEKSYKIYQELENERICAAGWGHYIYLCPVDMEYLADGSRLSKGSRWVKV